MMIRNKGSPARVLKVNDISRIAMAVGEDVI